MQQQNLNCDVNGITAIITALATATTTASDEKCSIVENDSIVNKESYSIGIVVCVDFLQ